MGPVLLLSSACAVAAAEPSGPDGPPTPGAPTVVITGSVAERTVLEAPYAISIVDRETLRQSGPMVNLSEALVRVPGLSALHRHNYAQDQQISSRGFGSRATFGVRGLRLLSDGIPATMPDGQGQVSHFDLAGAQRIEVLRGPFSVLYGASSGGVVSVISSRAQRQQTEWALDAGSFGHRQLRLSHQQPLPEGWDLRATVSALEVAGFRPHAAGRRHLAQVRLGWTGPRDRWVFLGNAVKQDGQDPLGLTPEQWQADPRQTVGLATQYDTRKDTAQWQGGAAWTRRFDDGALQEMQLSAYLGQRDVTQWLAIAPTVQAAPRHGGGVVDFERRYLGAQGRWRGAWEAVQWVFGASLEQQIDDRRGFENFTGPAGAVRLGTTGVLRRLEDNRARAVDVFTQIEVPAGRSLTAVGGLRVGRVALQAQDRFRSNGDDSGRLVLNHVLPVLGLRWDLPAGWVIHASAARGSETPTLGELAYRPDGVGGFNTDLRAQSSRQWEVGAKWRDAAWSVDLALFRIGVDDEIAVATNAGGRSSFQNVGRTRRAGAEMAVAWRGSGPWGLSVTASSLQARYRDAFRVCAAAPCTTPTVPVPAGGRLAGTSAGSVWMELVHRRDGGGEWAIEARAQGRTAANDANTVFAPGHALASARWSRTLSRDAQGRLELLVRIDNLTDRRHVGSLIVNEANGRFFEPGPPRHFLLALRLITND